MNSYVIWSAPAFNMTSKKKKLGFRGKSEPTCEVQEFIVNLQNKCLALSNRPHCANSVADKCNTICTSSFE